MESLNDRVVSTPDAHHAHQLSQHLLASALGEPQSRSRAADTHPVEPHPTQPAKPIEPTAPTHPVEPPTKPVVPTKPTHPVEPPTHPVEPPSRPPVDRHNPASPPAETFHPVKAQRQDTVAPPKEDKHTPVAEHPVPEKPVVSIAPPPEKSHTAPPPEKTTPVVPPEKHGPSTPAESHQKPAELHFTYDHIYKSHEVRTTVEHHAEQSASKSDKQKHVEKSAHEKKETHQASHSAHHSDRSDHTTHHHTTHRTHAPHHETHHAPSHHAEAHHPPRQAETHHTTHHHADTHHAATNHADTHHKAVQKDTSHVVDKAHHEEKKKASDSTTIHVDKKDVIEQTHMDLRIVFPETTKPAESKPTVDPPKEPIVAPPKVQEPTEKVPQPAKPVVVEVPPAVASPAAEPTRVETPASAKHFVPKDSFEINSSLSPGQTTLEGRYTHNLSDRNYVVGTVNAGVSGDHVGLGNVSVMAGHHLFSPYDKNGNPTRGNLNVEGGMVLKTGHTYDFGKLPTFGDTAMVAGVNGYYQPTRDLTLYGAAQGATNPKQYDLQFGAIKDSGRFSFQLGGEVSKVEGYSTSHFFTPGVSYRLDKNTSISVSRAQNLDGHNETSGNFIGISRRF